MLCNESSQGKKIKTTKVEEISECYEEWGMNVWQQKLVKTQNISNDDRRSEYSTQN